MKITAVIPTIGRDTLERAVLSLLSQEMGEDALEVIVVNDSGKTLPPADWQNHPQVRVVTTNRVERSLACNVGAALGQGKYVKFLHDDDYLLPGALPALYNLAESAPDDTVWIYGALNRTDNEDNFQSVDAPGPEVSGNLFALFVTQECLHVAPAILSRSAFLKVGGFDNTWAMREDLELEARLALIGTFVRTDRVIANVRVGEAGSTSDWTKVRGKSIEARERAVTLPDADRRCRASLKGNPAFARNVPLHGRVFRAYALTAYHNLRAGRITTAFSRLARGAGLVGFRLLLPAFWQGFLLRPH